MLIHPSPLYPEESRLGLEVHYPRASESVGLLGQIPKLTAAALSRETGCFRLRRGNLLLWLVCRHLLVKEEGSHARPDILQRVDQQRRGNAYGERSDVSVELD